MIRAERKEQQGIERNSQKRTNKVKKGADKHRKTHGGVTQAYIIPRTSRKRKKKKTNRNHRITFIPKFAVWMFLLSLHTTY
jgi:hypothetical protein